MVKEKLSWKWKVTIALVILIIFTFGFIFTPWGFTVMKDFLHTRYMECPEKERAEHWTADWYLTLAYWQGNVCGRREEANQMYLEFLGVGKHKDGQDFFSYYKATGMPRFNGYWDPKTKTGWGYVHPRACEVYWRYLELNESWLSAQYTADAAEHYFTLFHELHSRNVKGYKPHPQFYVHWDKVRDRILKAHRPAPVPMQKPQGFPP